MLLVQLLKHCNDINANLLLQLSNYVLVFIFTFVINNKMDYTTIKMLFKLYWLNKMLLVQLNEYC
jgi:hypothetical protein